MVAVRRAFVSLIQHTLMLYEMTQSKNPRRSQAIVGDAVEMFIQMENWDGLAVIFSQLPSGMAIALANRSWVNCALRATYSTTFLYRASSDDADQQPSRKASHNNKTDVRYWMPSVIVALAQLGMMQRYSSSDRHVRCHVGSQVTPLLSSYGHRSSFIFRIFLPSVLSYGGSTPDVLCIIVADASEEARTHAEEVLPGFAWC